MVLRAAWRLAWMFRYLRAEARGTSDAFEAIVLLDRAYFARISGEQNWTLNEVAKAEAIAERVDWNGLAGDERIWLLLFAEALAESDHEKAHFYLACSNGLDRIRSPLHLFAFDRPVEPFAAYAEGSSRLRKRSGSRRRAPQGVGYL
jgi:hypothetical protein